MRRKLSLPVTTPEKEVNEANVATVQELRAAQASGISAQRLVLSGGKITDARRFRRGRDKQSALLDRRPFWKCRSASGGWKPTWSGN